MLIRRGLRFAGAADRGMDDPWYDGVTFSNLDGAYTEIAGKKLRAYVQVGSVGYVREEPGRIICHELLHTLGISTSSSSSPMANNESRSTLTYAWLLGTDGYLVEVKEALYGVAKPWHLLAYNRKGELLWTRDFADHVAAAVPTESGAVLWLNGGKISHISAKDSALTGLDLRGDGFTLRDGTVYALGHRHTPGDWGVEQQAALGQTGWKVQKCTGCGTVLARESIPAILPAAAQPKLWQITMDGRPVELATYALEDTSGTVNYMRVRDLAVLLSGTPAQFDAVWSGKADLVTGTPYTGPTEQAPFNTPMEYEMLADPTYVNGEPVSLPAIRITCQQAGYTYYKLYDLAAALNFNIGWTRETGIFLETGKPFDPGS